MPKHIFVLGLLDWQRKELESIKYADQYRFHSLLTKEELVEHPPGFNELLNRARRQLDAFDGEPAGLVCHWDFPSSCLTPILAAEYDLPAPTLESVLKCEHKYWARLEQAKAVPECIPHFQAVNPFDPRAADKLELDFPVWIKPVKGFSSHLGFKVEDRDMLERALDEMREHIGEIGRLFNECLAHCKLPDEVADIDGYHAIAESIIGGQQHAPEGFVLHGRIHVHGIFDMAIRQEGKEISHLLYPSTTSENLQDRMVDACRRILRQVAFDNGCYNVEFLADKANDKLWIIEVNTRISQSHSDLLLKVDGISNHEFAVCVATGMRPQIPEHCGRYRFAGKFMLNKVDDAEVTRAPTAKEIEAVARELGDALIVLDVEEGDRLSDLPNQSQYSFTIGDAWIGADSEEELLAKYDRCVRELPLRFSDGKGLST